MSVYRDFFPTFFWTKFFFPLRCKNMKKTTLIYTNTRFYGCKLYEFLVISVHIYMSCFMQDVVRKKKSEEKKKRIFFIDEEILLLFRNIFFNTILQHYIEKFPIYVTT